MSPEPMLTRYTASQRCNHWALALCFVLAALSGLPFFHPAFFWLTNLFGSGTWARILHPFFGVTMAVLFFIWVARIWKDHRVTAVDWQWAGHWSDIFTNRTDRLPELGKYNLGQKYLTRTLLVAITALLASGILLWQPWLAPRFAIDWRRLAVLTHALAAFVALLCFITHVYAAYWTKGSIRAMTRGTVSTAWARHHHAAWYREMINRH